MTRPRYEWRLSDAGRATSTTLDVVLCLVLLSAAVGVLAAAGPPERTHDPRSASRAANLLATTTVTVEYTPTVDAPTVTRGPDVVESGPRPRVAHGTPAALLARAAVLDSTVEGASTVPGAATRPTVGATSADAFVNAVSTRTRRVLAGVDAHVNVTATYAPVAGSDRRGRVAVGPEVPAAVDVSVARVRVPVAARPTAAPSRTVTVVVRTWSP